MNDTLYIDRLTYQEVGSRSAKVFAGDVLDKKKIEKALSLLSQGKLKFIEARNEEECISITIRIDGQKSWIGILDSCDESSYIYDNQTDDENAVAIAGDDYPGWAICSEIETAKQIFAEFAYNGVRLSSVAWREDDM